MHVVLANPRGFCAGVNMAIDALDTALAHFGPPIYVYHEIVHNRPIVAKYKAKRGGVRGPPVRGAGRQHGAVQRPRGVAGGAGRVQGAEPAGHRRHLPAGDEGPPGGGEVRQGRVHHPVHRPRGARRGDRDDGRGPALHGAGGERGGCRNADPAGRRQAGLPDPDDAQRGRDGGHHRGHPAEVPACGGAEQGGHLLRHPEPAGGGAGHRAGGRRDGGAGQPEQLELAAAGRDRPAERQAGAPDRHGGRAAGRLVRRRRHGAGDGRGQRPGGARGGGGEPPAGSGSGRRSRAGRCGRSTSSSRCRRSCGCWPTNRGAGTCGRNPAVGQCGCERSAAGCRSKHSSGRCR